MIYRCPLTYHHICIIAIQSQTSSSSSYDTQDPIIYVIYSHTESYILLLLHSQTSSSSSCDIEASICYIYIKGGYITDSVIYIIGRYIAIQSCILLLLLCDISIIYVIYSHTESYTLLFIGACIVYIKGGNIEDSIIYIIG